MIDFSRNHFELFGLPERFRFDRGARSTAPTSGCRAKCIPIVTRPPATSEQRLALQSSARVNEAYRALKDPVARAQYLLSLHGVDAFDETDTALAFDFLERQLERREAAAEAAEAGDARALEAILDEVRAEARELEAARLVAARRRGRMGRSARDRARAPLSDEGRRRTSTRCSTGWKGDELPRLSRLRRPGTR